MPSLTFLVPGPPQGARRHRMARRGAGLRAYHGEEQTTAEAAVTHAARQAMALEGWTTTSAPVLVEILSEHHRPGRLCRKMDRGGPCLPFAAKPDADNVAKLVMDGCTKAGVWTDDTVVSDLVVRRRYVALDSDGVCSDPGVSVRVTIL